MFRAEKGSVPQLIGKRLGTCTPWSNSKKGDKWVV